VGVDGGGVEETWVLSIVCERLTTGCMIVATFGAGGGTPTINLTIFWNGAIEPAHLGIVAIENGN